MFEYFPDNYPWSLATMWAINRGGSISEIDEACRPLRQVAAKNDKAAQEAWFENWKKLAERVEALGRGHEQAGENLSAGRKYLRASIYYFMAERMVSSHDPRKVRAYRQGLEMFKKGVQFRGEPIEWVEIPYQGKSLPALFTKPSIPGRAPCMIHFDGFDGLKESSYRGAAEEFRRRGIALLVVDHPGVGEALRLRNMPSGPDTEVPAGACVDYLETRLDVDSNRIGILALSLGGYYAPRAAAFEKRLKCCVAWGGVWDWGERISKRIQGLGGEPSLPDWADQLLWVLGKKTLEEAVATAQKFSLKEIADKITCPLLVIHGENDRQIPVEAAEKTVAAAINSPERKLKIFTLADGGAEHCQADNATMAVDCIADWVAKVLGGDSKGVAAE